MRKLFGSTARIYRTYRDFRKRNRAYRIYRLVNYAVVGLFAAYFLTIAFPQYLFAYETSQGNVHVYSQQPLDENIGRVLDSAQARLVRSEIYNGDKERRVFLTGSHGFYTFFSNKAYRSFANSVPLFNNILVNRSDVAADRVYLDRPIRNNRSLSGVIAHEITHLLIRERYGVARSVLSIPTWKNEGYCEYIAVDTTITFEDGVKLWREDPQDDSKYAYFKYHQMVKYLLDDEKISVDDLFTRDFDLKELEARVFAKICQN